VEEGAISALSTGPLMCAEGEAKAPDGSSREVSCSGGSGRGGTDGNVASRPIPLSLGAGSGAPTCPPVPV